MEKAWILIPPGQDTIGENYRSERLPLPIDDGSLKLCPHMRQGGPKLPVGLRVYAPMALPGCLQMQVLSDAPNCLRLCSWECTPCGCPLSFSRRQVWLSNLGLMLSLWSLAHLWEGISREWRTALYLLWYLSTVRWGAALSTFSKGKHL